MNKTPENTKKIFKRKYSTIYELKQLIETNLAKKKK